MTSWNRLRPPLTLDLGDDKPVADTKPVANFNSKQIEKFIGILFPDTLEIGEKPLLQFALEMHETLFNPLKDKKKTRTIMTFEITDPPSAGSDTSGITDPSSAGSDTSGTTDTSSVGSDTPKSADEKLLKKVNQGINIGKDNYPLVADLNFKTDEKFFFKTYTFHLNARFTYSTYVAILVEIIAQLYAIELLETKCSESASVIIPKIFSIEMKLLDDGNAMSINGNMISIEICMEKLENIVKFWDKDETVSKIESEFDSWNEKIKKLFKCFESNGLYHNDTHRENLIFILKGETMELGLIDFGKATFGKPSAIPTGTGFANLDPETSELETSERRTSELETSKRRTSELEHFKRWMRRENVGKFSETKLYGGKKSKTKRRKSKNKSKSKRKTKSKRAKRSRKSKQTS